MSTRTSTCSWRRRRPSVQENRSSNGRYRISRNRSIVGAINGGGPEFELRTFNSNVYVRKGK